MLYNSVFKGTKLPVNKKYRLSKGDWCQDYLVELDSLIGDEDDLVPVCPTETQNICVLRLQDETNTQEQFIYLITQKPNRKKERRGFKIKDQVAYLAFLGELCVRIVGDEVDQILQTR